MAKAMLPRLPTATVTPEVQQAAEQLKAGTLRTILCVMTDLLSDLAQLSPQQRLELIEWLWDSLENTDIPVTTAQSAELERRLASFDQDREHGVAWQELRSKLRQQR